MLTPIHRRPHRLRYPAAAFTLVVLVYGALPASAETSHFPHRPPHHSRFATTRLPGGETVDHPVGWAVQDAGDQLFLLGHDTGEAIIVGRRASASRGRAEATAQALLDQAGAFRRSPVVTDRFRLGPNLFVEAIAKGPDGFESTILVLVSGAEGHLSPIASEERAAPRVGSRIFLYATYSGPPEHYDPQRVSRLLLRVVASIRERAPTPPE